METTITQVILFLLTFNTHKLL